MKIYVDRNALCSGDGSEAYPFRCINEAAKTALPGDEVIVAPGIYREYVDPVHAGTPERRIVYRSREKLGAVITGSEEVKNWKPFDGTVWKCEIPNGLFGNYNPYTTLVEGDWFIASFRAHTGEVYLNEKSLYEVTTLEKVLSPEVSKASWDPDFSIYTWYTEQENGQTVIYANFHGTDPNKAHVEINVRRNCFYPSAEGIGFITLSGFKVCRAATQWAPPTAYQEGMIGPHWSKGWIIEDCELFQSKCSGISLGKYLQPENDNKWLRRKFKDGTQTEREAICQAQREGWTKENIGSHTIRRCNIHDCGQTGIVGHLGGVFSIIEDNHIHHINNKQNLAGAEIGGIKMHAAIDVIFRRNHIHHCTRGLWLDWQAQGTRVTRNLFHDNALPSEHLMCEEALGGLGEDIFVEVSHGPTLIDNNLLLSVRSLKLATQGAAVVHNLISGAMTTVGRGVNNGAATRLSPRYTPYHVPHRTEIAGFMTILHGDMRFCNNVFVQQGIHPFMKKTMESWKTNEWDDGNIIAGTWPYSGYPTREQWLAQFEGYCGMGSEKSDRYYNPLPVLAEGNCFFNGARPGDADRDKYEDTEHHITLEIEEKKDAEGNSRWVLKTNLFSYLPQEGCRCISTAVLGEAFEPEQRFENPDGTEIIFNTDYYGKHRPVKPTAGPLEAVNGSELCLC